LTNQSKWHIEKDAFQIANSVLSNGKKAIDKSAFRKNIGRLHHVRPGEETVRFIQENFTVRFIVLGTIELAKSLEEEIIRCHQPRYNIVGNPDAHWTLSSPDPRFINFQRIATPISFPWHNHHPESRALQWHCESIRWALPADLIDYSPGAGVDLGNVLAAALPVAGMPQVDGDLKIGLVAYDDVGNESDQAKSVFPFDFTPPTPPTGWFI
jgi:hypothetical protein